MWVLHAASILAKRGVFLVGYFLFFSWDGSNCYVICRVGCSHLMARMLGCALWRSVPHYPQGPISHFFHLGSWVKLSCFGGREWNAMRHEHGQLCMFGTFCCASARSWRAVPGILARRFFAMQRHHEEPDAKKARASDPAFPTPAFLDDLTAVLAAALGTDKGTHGSTVVEASTTSTGRNCLEPAPAPKAKAKPVQVGFYPSVNPNVDPYKYQTVTLRSGASGMSAMLRKSAVKTRWAAGLCEQLVGGAKKRSGIGGSVLALCCSGQLVGLRLRFMLASLLALKYPVVGN